MPVGLLAAKVNIGSNGVSAEARRSLQQELSKAPLVKSNKPVRKKHDREALQGTDCKQCKKFYDAVAVEDADGVRLPQCQHVNEVSRHWFKYLPLATPLGFGI
ncbi:unnamed protein product [Calypogeia fissa]